MKEYSGRNIATPPRPRLVCGRTIHDGGYDIWVTGEDIRSEVHSFAKIFCDCHDLTICPILTGGLSFAALFGRMAEKCRVPPFKVSPIIATSYGTGQTGQSPTIFSEWLKEGSTYDVRGRTVLMLDDILDSGKTAQAAVKILEGLEPKEILTAFLLRKVDSERPFQGTYSLFDVPTRHPDTKRKLFFVGSGMDWAGEHRFVENVFDVNSGPVPQVHD